MERSGLISIDLHNVLDYVVGVLLVVSPYLFGFSDVQAARNLFLATGFGLIAYSLVTQYRYSLVKILPLGAHMTLDVILGILLILGPTAWGYGPLLTGFQNLLHYIFGVGAVMLVALTSPRSQERMAKTTPFRRPGIDRAA